MEVTDLKCVLELRIWERHADRLLPKGEGKTLGGLVRQVFWQPDDPRLREVAELDRELGDGFFSYWEFHRRYTREELDRADLFLLTINRAFEPAGEECGTAYDEASTCPVCGAGRRQLSELRLDAKMLPKGVDFAQTIALDEWIVSDRLAGVLAQGEATGYELRPIRECGKGGGPITGWSQLIVTSKPVPMSPETRFGETPFDRAKENPSSCPTGDTVGPRVLSEVHARCTDWNGSDFAVTMQYVGRGRRSGVVRPSRLILVSPRLRRLLRDQKVKGWRVEVARCSDR